jgi:diadenosine tetraphosphate (Ap4A) HIT family hydrolase
MMMMMMMTMMMLVLMALLLLLLMLLLLIVAMQPAQYSHLLVIPRSSAPCSSSLTAAVAGLDHRP